MQSYTNTTTKVNYENNISVNTFTGGAGTPSGFVGRKETYSQIGVTFANNYWDTTTSGITRPMNASTSAVAGITGKTTTDLKVNNTTTYPTASWDRTIWTFAAGKYPTLKNVPYP